MFGMTLCVVSHDIFISYTIMAMFVFLFVLVFRLPILDSCGVSTHISIANQALQSFSDSNYYNVSYRNIILENLDAFYAGSTYPDAMYPSICFDGHYHQVAEDTHWAPFLNASVNYIRKTFPKPWNEATKKLVAFILGVVSHQVADISWHSLGIDQGFLHTMGKVNFHGSYSTAHPVGDFGGDMVSMFEGDLQGVLPLHSWYVPVGDLVNIYKVLYNDDKIDAEVIYSCSELLYLEAVGESLAGADLFAIFARKSPFLVEELHSYYLGGKSDMAAWTSTIWANAVYMIENGTTACEIPKSPLYLKCPPQQGVVKYSKEDRKLRSRSRPPLMYVKYVNRRDIIKKATLRGVYVTTGGRTAEQLENANSRFIGGENQIGDEREALKFFTKNKYAQLGWSLVTDQLPLFGQVLITGAPWFGLPGNSQYGRVYVLSAKKNYSKDADVDEVADQILEGKNENSRFGFALAVLDFNQDGVNDLAVGAPSEGSNDLNYTGKVYIYYGNTHTGLNNNPDVIIEGDEHYYNLGTSLVAGDVNQDGYKDLVIGSKYAPMSGEQRGSVAVFFSSEKINYYSSPVHYFSNQSDWLLKGEQNYSWFGSAMTFHSNTSIGPLLLVSAPTFRICAINNCSYSQDDVQSVGKIYAYRWLSNGASKLLFEITGEESLGKLGTSMIIGDPFGSGKSDVLAVSTPTAEVKGHLPFHVPTTFDQAGQVFLLNITTLAYRRTIMLSQADYITRFEGNRNYGRFGWHLSWQDVNDDDIDDLIFGSPYHTEDLAEINGGEQGAVYVFYGGKSFSRGDATSNCDLVRVEPCPEDKV